MSKKQGKKDTNDALDPLRANALDSSLRSELSMRYIGLTLLNLKSACATKNIKYSDLASMRPKPLGEWLMFEALGI